MKSLFYSHRHYVPKSFKDAYNLKSQISGFYSDQVKELDVTQALILFLHMYACPGPVFKVHPERFVCDLVRCARKGPTTLVICLSLTSSLL